VERDKLTFAQLRQGYETGDASGVLDYFMAQLNAIPLPGWCPRGFQLHFDGPEGVLLLECQLPYFGSLEIVKTKELVSGSRVVPATQREARDLTNQLLCLLPLRLIWEIPQVDYRQRVALVCCNAYVDYDDPATGRHRRDVILSVAAKTEDLK